MGRTNGKRFPRRRKQLPDAVQSLFFGGKSSINQVRVGTLVPHFEANDLFGQLVDQFLERLHGQFTHVLAALLPFGRRIALFENMEFLSTDVLLGPGERARIGEEGLFMPLLEIPDEILKLAGLSEREAMVEFACRLFDAGKLPLWPAAKLAALSRVEMQAALRQRRIAVYRPTLQDFAEDMAAVKELRKKQSLWLSALPVCLACSLTRSSTGLCLLSNRFSIAFRPRQLSSFGRSYAKKY